MAQTTTERIRFACAECDQLLSISAGRVGQIVACPKCSCPNEVPDAEAAALQIADRKLRKQQRLREREKESDSDREIDKDFTQFAVYDDETEFIFESDDDEGYYRGNVDREKVAVPRWVLYAQGALLGVVAVGAFTFGWIFGAVMSRSDTAAVAPDTPHVVKGALTYADGERQRPDAGSVVILVPDRSVSPDEKVDIGGLRPDDPLPEDATHPGLQQIAALGGAYTRTDADGAYRLQVPRRGSYFMLIVSGNATRGSNDALDREDLAQMGRYFTPPTDLIGDRRYRWTNEKIGDDMTINYSFDL